MRTRKQYRALLDRAHGYSAQVRRLMPARRAPATSQRAWTFAQANAERYTEIERRWPVMAFIFEQSGNAGVSVSNTSHTTHPSIFMNPRLILRMLISHRQEVPRTVADRTPVQPFVAERAPLTLAVSPRPKQGLQERDDVIARIVRRAVRDERALTVNVRPIERSSVRATQGVPAEIDASIRSPSLARVYRHTAKTTRDAAVEAAAMRSEQEKFRAVPGFETTRTAVAQSPLDIARVTEQVIQALDQRIVAQQERMGRG